MTPWFNFKYLALSKGQAAVPAEGILIPRHRQYLLVSGKNYETLNTYCLNFDKVLNKYFSATEW